MQHSCYHTVELSALTTGGNTFIWVGGEEGCIIWAVATLQLYICHGTEVTDGVDEFLVVPADRTTYCVKAQLVDVCESKHKLMKNKMIDCDEQQRVGELLYQESQVGSTRGPQAWYTLGLGHVYSIKRWSENKHHVFRRGHCCDVDKLWNYEFVTVLDTENYIF